MTSILFVGNRLVVGADHARTPLPAAGRLLEVLGPEEIERSSVDVRVVTTGGNPVSVHVLDAEATVVSTLEAAGLRLVPLRTAWRELDPEDFRLAGTARQKAEWIRTHRFCSHCAARTELDPRTEGLTCTRCGQIHYPRVAPAVIVLVQRGREALLGRSSRFPAGVYSTLAGFVEPGETLEECVHREIEEESGVRVHNLRYFGSQSHPFPHSLMVGFVADWLEGDVVVDPDELEDARWFDVDDLPPRPHPRSIAHALIADFEARARQGCRTR